MIDVELKLRGFEVLSRSMGLVDAERFICLIQREKFDYTKWRQTLFEGVAGEEISRRAMAMQKDGEEQCGAASSQSESAKK